MPPLEIVQRAIGDNAAPVSLDQFRQFKLADDLSIG